MPDGAVLSAGIDNGDGTWTLNPEDLEGLTFTPPPLLVGSIELSVSAVSEETQSGDQATNTQILYIEVPDPLNLSVVVDGRDDTHAFDPSLDPGLNDLVVADDLMFIASLDTDTPDANAMDAINPIDSNGTVAPEDLLIDDIPEVF